MAFSLYASFSVCFLNLLSWIHREIILGLNINSLLLLAFCSLQGKENRASSWRLNSQSREIFKRKLAEALAVNRIRIMAFMNKHLLLLTANPQSASEIFLRTT
ncbi:hypothetical protein QN277_000542 [Acacia crassicarpa]|uniref:Uncharacterized protein n=1 Tax=Acacia crassicarpa TaxID=499986 RepID=A0AAE1TH90_9FABA|nr:hypothetical protein QN277_000542 [Acacia crassicarpa]